MSRDLRKYARNTNLQLLFGFILLLIIVGGSLIYIFYGLQGTIFGLLCLIAGISPLIIIAGILKVMDWIVKRANNV